MHLFFIIINLSTVFLSSNTTLDSNIFNRTMLETGSIPRQSSSIKEISDKILNKLKCILNEEFKIHYSEFKTNIKNNLESSNTEKNQFVDILIDNVCIPIEEIWQKYNSELSNCIEMAFDEFDKRLVLIKKIYNEDKYQNEKTEGEFSIFLQKNKVQNCKSSNKNKINNINDENTKNLTNINLQSVTMENTTNETLNINNEEQVLKNTTQQNYPNIEAEKSVSFEIEDNFKLKNITLQSEKSSNLNVKSEQSFVNTENKNLLTINEKFYQFLEKGMFIAIEDSQCKMYYVLQGFKEHLLKHVQNNSEIILYELKYTIFRNNETLYYNARRYLSDINKKIRHCISKIIDDVKKELLDNLIN